MSDLQTLTDEELDAVIGGGKFTWAARGLGYAWRGLKWAGNKIVDGVGDGFKAIGKWGTGLASAEAGSRGLEKSTGIRTPRPSDLIDNDTQAP